MAAVMDGGLLGASETTWVSRASIISSGLVVLSLIAVKRAFPTSLVALWMAMKVQYTLPHSLRRDAHSETVRLGISKSLARPLTNL